MGTGCRSATSSLFLDLPYNIKFRLFFFFLFCLLSFCTGMEERLHPAWVDGWMDGILTG